MTELRRKDIKPCAKCGHGVMKCGSPIFYRIKLNSFVVDLNAVQRQAGLEMMIGDPFLAQFMGPDAPLAKGVESAEITLCQACAPTLTFLEMFELKEKAYEETQP